jgi:hypothetical protein
MDLLSLSATAESSPGGLTSWITDFVSGNGLVAAGAEFRYFDR